MPAKAKRTTDERTQDRMKATSLLGELRATITDLQAAIAALPAPASRTAAQKRDALVLRTLVKLIRWNIIAAGAGTAADRTAEPD